MEAHENPGSAGKPRLLAVAWILTISTAGFAQAPPLLETGPLLPPPQKSPTSPVIEAQLSVEAVVQQVLQRNPTLAQMVAAWNAASARYPQVTALDDPMLGTTAAPASIGSNEVDFAYRVEITQKYPYCGKRRLRGDIANAEAGAAGDEVESVRLELIESARLAFADYYLADRALVVNAEGVRLLREFRDNAATRYRTGLAPQQDMLQADVEIGRQEVSRLILERARRVAVARINTLMHLPPDAVLPPPTDVQGRPGVPDAAALRQTALAQRPDLRAAGQRIAAEEAAIALAKKEYLPDFEVMAAYDAFWQRPEQDLRPQVGVRMNLPVRRQRRGGAVAEAAAKLAKRQAELASLTDRINFEVQQAYEQVRESEQTVRLFDQTILPAVRTSVTAAQSAYVNGKTPFLSLIEAQRNQVGFQERALEAAADYFRRLASLERVIGGY